MAWTDAARAAAAATRAAHKNGDHRGGIVHTSSIPHMPSSVVQTAVKHNATVRMNHHGNGSKSFSVYAPGKNGMNSGPWDVNHRSTPSGTVALIKRLYKGK